MSNEDFGHCSHCKTPLKARYWSLDRNIEVISYTKLGRRAKSIINVLDCQGLMQLCSKDCARAAVSALMASLGYSRLNPGVSPIEPCSKCGAPTDLTQMHVAYNLLVGTEIQKPWLTEYAPETGETVAILCQKCDPPAFEIAEELGDPAESDHVLVTS